jgi:hypothetical protein
MRIILIALATLATTAIAMPVASHAEDAVIIKKDNGHHYGWRHRHHKKVVVIKDRDHHRYHHTTTGVGVGVRIGE